MTDDNNRIQFQVPVHVLNIDSVTNGITRYLSFGIKIGNKKLWSALHEVTIEEPEEITDVGEPTTIRVCEMCY